MTKGMTITPGLLWVRLMGGTKENLEQLYVALAMLAVMGLYQAVSGYFAPEHSFNAYEFLGTWSGLVCVWLSRTRNILCWPWGIASALFLGAFFGEIALPGQQWLNWGYFFLIQIWSWPYWAFGGAERAELPVTSLSWRGRAMTVAAVALGTLACYLAIGYLSPGSFHPVLDALVTAASVVAQYLLGKKKVESWWLWLGPVNLLSVILFFLAGAYLVTALYVAFFIHAIFALRAWAAADGAHNTHV